MAAIGDLIRRQWSTDPVAVITLPGDRRDDLIEETARAVAQMSDRVVVYEDEDKRGRAPGEMTNLIASALIDARPSLQCIAATGVKHALTTALALAAPSGPILVVYEKLAPVIEMLQQFDTAHAALLRPDSPYLPIQRTERSEQPVPHTRQVPVRSDSTIR
jgi:cyanophycin synthetase